MKTVLNILTEEENARFAERLNRVGGKEEKLSDWLRRNHEDNLARLTDANGQIYYGKFNSYLDDVRRSEQLRNDRRIDIYKTEDSSLDRITKAGLTEDDYIAFPYGKNAVEGARADRNAEGMIW